jgi:hypothetical protein
MTAEAAAEVVTAEAAAAVEIAEAAVVEEAAAEGINQGLPTKTQVKKDIRIISKIIQDVTTQKIKA